MSLGIQKGRKKHAATTAHIARAATPVHRMRVLQHLRVPPPPKPTRGLPGRLRESGHPAKNQHSQQLQHIHPLPEGR